METEKKSFLEKLNSKWVTPFFTIIAVAYGFFIKINNDRLDDNAKTLNNLQTQINTELRQKEFENDLKLTIYKEVKASIEQKDSAIQNATLIIVNEMLKDDTIFREKLKTVMFASTGSKKLIQTQQKIDQFSAEQTSTTSTGFKIDIFFLDDVLNEAKPLAEKISDLLRRRYPNFIIRMRLLPKEINAQSGYRVDANQIRFESSEAQVANDIAKLIGEQNIFSLEKLRLHMTSYSTPNYISIFVRNM